ncbi:unnamed protein product [Diatraea saccharalis]|uniref:Uncharacterized protein n=1 Tax=Diatraea saccharalis TaxID=40085 RepID=A0A9N9WH85_9NEOP|nr:unnamed protein product [Diatraea saccharalis]
MHYLSARYKLGTDDQCLTFSEERGLILSTKNCRRHRKPMSLLKSKGAVGAFLCKINTCRSSASEGESSNAGSTSILKSSVLVNFTSALGLITDDLDVDGLLQGPGIDVDANDLFPVKEKRRGKKRKFNENDIIMERSTN